jgi:NAD(P)-dependent dehydrogenase (short-subunit alcohol dehydrogenase family)
VTGATLGAGVTAGAALLLYTGQGFLGTAGFLLCVSLASLAGGLWVGDSNEPRPPVIRGRWVWGIVAYAIAAAFAIFWSVRPSLRDQPIGGALAVLLVIAEPAYVAGAVLAALQARDRFATGVRGRVTIFAILGAGAGVLFATTALIPNLDAPQLFLGAAVALVFAGIAEAGATIDPLPGADMELDDKVVLITGVGHVGQLGHAIAERMLGEGARLVLVNRSASVEPIAEELGRRGDVIALRGDLTLPEDAMRIMGEVRERYGRLDALVNAAGGLTVIKTIADTRSEEWRGEIARNVDTAFQMSRAALPMLRESRGAIVNFTSPAGERASGSMGAYSAGKAAVIALTRALAIEERANGVRANAIAPGMIDTEQNRQAWGVEEDARFVTREEVANVVAFLISPAGSGITGETVHVLGDTIQ